MKISVIIPIYNNEKSLAELIERVVAVSKNTVFNKHEFELICVNDGSSDNSIKVLREESSKINIPCIIINLTRNFGSYNAFLAGMNYASGKCNIHLHADLQDPPEHILKMFPHFDKGYKLVIANRENREDKSVFSDFYHYLVKKVAIKKTPSGGFDLILFDEKIRKEVVNISEKHTNNVYLINWLGYEFVNVPYTRLKRKHGKSQWHFTKKLSLFADTFFSFSNIPIVIIRSVFYFSFLIFLTTLTLVLLNQSFTIVSPLFLFSTFFFLNNLSLVIIVEYINRIHETVRNRPNFVVEKVEKNNF